MAYYLGSNRQFQADPLSMLKVERNRCPQHFIYSKTDDLIPYEVSERERAREFRWKNNKIVALLFQDIQYFTAYRRSMGVDVTELCFEDSPHVKHYIANKETYVNSVCTFLNKCLNGGKTDQERFEPKHVSFDSVFKSNRVINQFTFAFIRSFKLRPYINTYSMARRLFQFFCQYFCKEILFRTRKLLTVTTFGAGFSEKKNCTSFMLKIKFVSFNLLLFYYYAHVQVIFYSILSSSERF